MQSRGKKKKIFAEKVVVEKQVELHTPFIEHLSIKPLRGFVKYGFRTFGIVAVAVFWFITWYSIYILFRIGHSLWHKIPISPLGMIEIYLVIEAIFFMGMNIKYSIFKKLVDSLNHLPQVSKIDFLDLQTEFLNIPDIKSWVEGWFLKTPWDKITYEDCEEWCACALFNSRPLELEENQLFMARELVQTIEEKLPGPFRRRGLNEKGCPKLLLTLDSPKIYHRPLIVYLGIVFIHGFSRAALKTVGYSYFRNSSQGLPFFFRNGSSKKPAIVFFHGLGIGVSIYVLTCAGLAFKYPDRDIILFEMPSVSMKLDDNHLFPEEFSDHVANTLADLGIDSGIFAGHSLGSCCVSWMLRFHPQLVKGTLFIDPICFKLWTHHIAYNALYRKPRNFHEAFLSLVAMTEPGHSIFLHRYFVWWQNCILTKDLPTNSIIFMSEYDNIVQTDQVVDYLVENSHPFRKLVLFKAFRHGQIFFSPEFTMVIAAFKELDLMIAQN